MCHAFHRFPTVLRPWATLLAFIGAACGEPNAEGSSENPPGEPGAVESPDPPGGSRTYQRTVVFIDTSQDTTMFVPWDFESRSEPGGVARTLRGWLGRAGQWALFMEDDWVTAPSRAPWRILPRGPARLVMDAEDALRTIYYQEGLRDLSIELGPTLVEWRGQRGEIYRLAEGSARLSESTTAGLVLDVSTARLTEEPEPAEWGLLTSGDGVQLLLVDPEGPGPYRAWAKMGEQDLAWPEVTVTWAETRSFERARRPVPVLWQFESDDGLLTGEFEAVSSHFQTLEGDGVILPALGVYEVAGTITIDEEETDVRGFLRHLQR